MIFVVEKSLVLTSFIALTNGQFVAPSIISCYSFVHLLDWHMAWQKHECIDHFTGFWVYLKLWNLNGWHVKVIWNTCTKIDWDCFNLIVTAFVFCSARPGRPPKRSPSIHASPETLEKLKKCRVDGDYPFDPRLYGK